MSLQKIGYSFIGVGGFIVLFMFLGKGGIRAASKVFFDRLVAGPHTGMNT